MTPDVGNEDEGTMLDGAKALAARGWNVLPLRPRDKIPILNSWQTAASSAVEHIEHWWTQTPTANVGVQLGPRSGIIDVECDTKEAEHALAELFDGDFPIVPTFQASRGKHRLFKWSDDLPQQAVIKFKAKPTDPDSHYIEFRLGGGELGAQSVFPPSKHPTGSIYRWLIHPDDVEIIELPRSIRWKLTLFMDAKRGGARGGSRKPNSPIEQEIFEAGKVDWVGMYSGGASEGARNSSAAQVVGKMLSDLKDIHDNSAAARVWALVLLWNEKSTPPLAERELRGVFNNVLIAARRNATNNEFDQAFAKFTDLSAALDEAAEAALPKKGEDNEISAVVAEPEEPATDVEPADAAEGEAAPAAEPAKKGRGKAKAKDAPASAPAKSTTITAPATAAASSTPEGWRLVIVESQPLTYKLYSPLWRNKTPGGFIKLGSTDEFMSGALVRRAAMEHSRVLVDRSFIKFWEGTADRKGLAAQLVDVHEIEEAAPETRRGDVVATLFYEALRKPIILDGDLRKEPDSMGAPTKLENGDIVFRFNKVWEDLARSDDKISRAELSELPKKVGARDVQFGVREARTRLKCLNSSAQKRLHEEIGLVE